MASKSRVGSKCRTLWVAILFLASISAIITVAVIQDKWRVKEYDFESILVKLREYFSAKPFMFQDASILTGQQEGLYGWVTVNYLLGNFVEKNLWNAFVRPDGAQTVGSMDLGGASTQLAFVVDGELHGEDYLALRLYGYDYNVYTHSYLCYGKDEAGKQILDRIARDSKDLSDIPNPCFPGGSNTTLKASSIYNSPCTKKPANFDPDQELVFVGVPDMKKCQAVAYAGFFYIARACCLNRPTEDGGSSNKQRSGTTAGRLDRGERSTGHLGEAYAGFFYIARALLLNETTEMEQFNSSVRDYCQADWTEVSAQPATWLKETRPWISDRYLRTYCYSSHYVLTLLAEGYKESLLAKFPLDFSAVKGTSVGWSLGYMLSMSNMIPSEAEYILPMSSPVFAGLIFLFSALTIITVVFLFVMLIRTCY
ncbi:hypothetical protein CRUP_003541 [Coryphaenoides rupestris]|nr:hypothetical protein CRUP_003541 [Coryphaenoides rupestris]